MTALIPDGPNGGAIGPAHPSNVRSEAEPASVARRARRRGMWRAAATGEGGAVAAEFALTLPVLAALFAGVAQFSFAFFHFADLANGVRTSARQVALSRASGTPWADAVSAMQFAAPDLSGASVSMTLYVNGQQCGATATATGNTANDAACASAIATAYAANPSGANASVQATYTGCTLQILGLNTACAPSATTTEIVE